MGKTKLVFKRFESKYLLSPERYRRLRERLDAYIEPDEYFKSTVCSVYYDSPDYELIRRSIEGPVYKEKLRLRSYNVPGPEDQVFVELKKKFKGVVYKRRLGMTARQAEDYLAGRAAAPVDDQMTREIDWFRQFNAPVPKVFIACDREAYRAKDEPELRVTFDRDIRWRSDRLSLIAGDQGQVLTAPGEVLMELKIPGAAPLWLSRLLSEEALFPTGFSKYGVCYKEHILPETINGVIFSA